MDIRLPFALGENHRTLLRRCGYAALNTPFSEKESYVRRLTGDYYPRFHIYSTEVDGGIVLHLHLDQKKPSYPGAHAHSGEYEGQTVEQEAARIQGLIKNQLDNQSQVNGTAKKGFLQRLFSS